MANYKKLKNEVYDLIETNTDLSIDRIEEFLEYLQDEDCLNERGIQLRSELWTLFIKEKETKE